MKQLPLLISALCIFCASSCSTNKSVHETSKPKNQTEWRNCPDSIALASLGDTVASIVFSPDSVLATKLIEKTSDTRLSKTKAHVAKFPMTNISDKDISALQILLLADGNNYKNDSIIVMSPFIPAMQVKFFKGCNAATITVSFSDHTWSIENNGKELFHHNYISEEPLTKIYSKLK